MSTSARPNTGAGRGPVVILVIAVVLAVGALLFSRAANGPSAASSKDTACEVQEVSVAVAPRVAKAAREGLDAIGHDCVAFKVAGRTDYQMMDAVYFGQDLPDLWIPDGDWSLGKMDVDVVSSAVASTPVLLVGGPAAPRAASWGQAMSTIEVAMPDPLEDSVGALALMAPRQEAQATKSDTEKVRSFLVPMAQRYGELTADGETVDLDLTTIKPGDARVVATTESDLMAALPENAGLRSVTPATGTELLSFPLVVPQNADQQTRVLAQDLADWFTSAEGEDALVAQHLRRGDGSAIEKGVGKVKVLPGPQSGQLDEYRLTWRSMSVPSSVLAVIDVSGSMDFPTAEGDRRIDVAAGVSEVALTVFPGHARVGSWVFSIDQGGKGQDWRQLQPLRRLDAVVGGKTQRQLLNESAEYMKSLTQGGTGLNDTALAAYQAAIKAYDERYSNTMILMTDGANDDPGSIGQKQLLAQLKALRDKDRPVRIIGVAISKDADLASLTQIAEATGGRAYRADTPEDILTVFATEIANR